MLKKWLFHLQNPLYIVNMLVMLGTTQVPQNQRFDRPFFSFFGGINESGVFSLSNSSSIVEISDSILI